MDDAPRTHGLRLQLTDGESAGLAPSLRWSAYGAISVRVVAGARSLVLARLAGPENLGVLAAVVAFASAAGLLSDSGLRSYLIHLGPAARSEARAVRRLALVTGLSAGGLLVVGAPLLSRLYDDKRVTAVAIAMAVTVFVPALVAVPDALMRLEFRFRDLALARLAGEFIGLVVGLAVAASGQKLGALVAAAICSQVGAAGALLLAYSRRRGPAPQPIGILKSDATNWRRPVVFGASVSAGGLAWLLALQGDNVAIGHLLGAQALGIYAFAFSYGTMPGALTGAIIGDVAGPAIALSEANKIRLFRELTLISAVVLGPMTAVGIAFAGPAVRVVLGPDWTAAIGPLKVMLALGFIRSVFPSPSLLRALGRVRVELVVGVVCGPLTVIAATVTAHQGLARVALAVSVVALGGELWTAWIALDAMPAQRLRALVSPVAPLVASAAVVGIVALLAAALNVSDTPRLLLGAPVALVAAFGAAIKPRNNIALFREHVLGSAK